MYEKLYQQLNAAQREAVDTIDGPVLVVAGPGTGKTQLLSMRVANILQNRDVTPRNILCLTFTEDAAENMRRRLATIIGQAAYDVEIHTFHSFGATIIAQYGEYFYQGVGANPVDDLGVYQIFEQIFQQLPHDNPLALQMDGEFYFLEGARTAIDNCKTAGFAPNEVDAIAQHNQMFIDINNPKIAKIMDGFIRVDKTTAKRFAELLAALRSEPTSADISLPSFVQPLANVVIRALEDSLQEYEATGKTTALTDFKNTFLEKNRKGKWQLKDSGATQKLKALADIYEKYLLELRKNNLLDFNDMITRVVHALETFDELRFNLQEQYQYILVDEFQDTSMAQLRMVQALTNNPLFEGQPNILAVGDDDQAIYSFQGAELSNILSFYQMYRDVKIITLTENYRSRQEILNGARFVIEQSNERLVHQLDNVTKDIIAKNSALPAAQIAHQRFNSAESQYQWVVERIKQVIAAGEQPQHIAIISAKHRSLKAIAAFLHAAKIPIHYDKRENILEVPAIIELLQCARLIDALAKGQQRIADALLPEVLSYEFWGLSTQQIWQLYLAHHRKRAPWLEIAQQSDDAPIQRIATFFVNLARQSQHMSIEAIFDLLIGEQPLKELSASGEQLQLAEVLTEFYSPFKEFYFSKDQQRRQPIEYLELLSHLRFLRDHIRDFSKTERLVLSDLLSYVSLCKKAGISLVDTSPHREQTNAVQLATAHGAKGLEFDIVFIIDANQEIWNGNGSRPGKLTMPSNLPIERASGSEDERRRLFYVAMTRAKHQLYITGFTSKKRGSGAVKFLINDPNMPEFLQTTEQDEADSSHAIMQQLQTTWQARHADVQPPLRELLRPKIEQYRVSITHLQRFLNVVEGGPQLWLQQSLLRFPQAPAPNMAFGSAIHETLDLAHKHLKKTGEQKPIHEIINDFSAALIRQRLEANDETRLLERGKKVLTHYFAERYQHFAQQEYFEFDFQSRRMVVDNVPVTGKIDRITPLGNNTFRVVDFKTGKPMHVWDTPDPLRKIRLYHYQQQLTFYRLLLEEGRIFGDTKVTETALEFVESQDNELAPLLLFTPTDEDVIRLRRLLAAAWQHMQTLEFPDISGYERSLKGIQEFEEDLINSNLSV